MSEGLCPFLLERDVYGEGVRWRRRRLERLIEIKSEREESVIGAEAIVESGGPVCDKVVEKKEFRNECEVNGRGGGGTSKGGGVRGVQERV